MRCGYGFLAENASFAASSRKRLLRGWQPRNPREDRAGRRAAGRGRRKHAKAGTVEFLMNEDEYCYFIEMSAPGIDPVKEQLKVAGARGHR
jgi:acetyl/propionyl-CoA carboxylase alpha subunit